MIECTERIEKEVNNGIETKRTMKTYIHSKCGHKQEFQWTTPYNCQTPGCDEKMPKVDTLIGTGVYKQGNRVEFFATSKI